MVWYGMGWDRMGLVLIKILIQTQISKDYEFQKVIGGHDLPQLVSGRLIVSDLEITIASRALRPCFREAS